MLQAAASMVSCRAGWLAPALLVIGCGGSPDALPTIAGLSPASLKVGSAPQTLSINGAHFVSSSTVTFNGVAHPATYVSASQLTIALSAADLSTLGSYPVAVSDPGTGGGMSNAVSLQVYGDGQNSAVIGSVVPSASYELDAFDIEGDYAYLLGDNGNQGRGSSAAQFYIVDVTNPAKMSLVSTTSVTGLIYYGQSGIRVQGQYVYVLSSTGTASTNLLQIFDVSNPSGPKPVGSVPVPLYGLGLWVSGKYAYVISYVGDAAASALEVVDVSNPAAPAVVGATTTGTAGLHVADIKVVGNYAYVAGQSGGPSAVLVFDVSDPASPKLLSSLPAAHSPQGLDVEGSYWYQTIFDGNALNVYDISSPSAPSLSGMAGLTGTCNPQNVAVEGPTAYVGCYANSSVAVVDVSVPASPKVDGYIPLPAGSFPIFLEVKGRYVYAISNAPGGSLAVIDTGQ